MIYENDDELGYFSDPSMVWFRAPVEPWDPAPPSDQSASIPGVDLSEEEQHHIEEAARRQFDNRSVAAEMSRERAGYAGLFDSSGRIV